MRTALDTIWWSIVVLAASPNLTSLYTYEAVVFAILEMMV